MNAENRRIPFVNGKVGRVLIGSGSLSRTVFVPVGIIVFPVRKPCLFGICIHGFKIESAVVCNETLKALIVMTGKIVNRETTEGCPYSS